MRLCLVPRKFEGKYKENEIERKNRRKEKKMKENKNRFKLNKLVLYVFSNSFHLVSSII